MVTKTGSGRLFRATAVLITLALLVSACANPARSGPTAPAGGALDPSRGSATVLAGVSASDGSAAPTPSGTAASTATVPAAPLRRTPPSTRGATPPRPTPAAIAGSKPVYDPTGRCRSDLPPFFTEEKPDGGYYPAVDRSGFAALDAHDLPDGTGYDEAVAYALDVIHSLVRDYAQTASTRAGEALVVTFTGGVNGLNGHGTVEFRRFGTTLCQVTLFVLDYTGVDAKPLVTAFAGRLELVDPTVPRPAPTAPFSPPAPPTPLPIPSTVTPATQGDATMRALALIAAVPEMRYITDTLRDRAVPISAGYLPAGTYGTYNVAANSIRYAYALVNYDPHDLAAVIGHEGQHAFDTLTIGRHNGGIACYQAEYRGFWAEAMLWMAWYGPKGKPNPTNDLEREENIALADILLNDGRDVRAFIARSYQDQCGMLQPPQVVGAPVSPPISTGWLIAHARRLGWIA